MALLPSLLLSCRVYVKFSTALQHEGTKSIEVHVLQCEGPFWTLVVTITCVQNENCLSSATQEREDERCRGVESILANSRVLCACELQEMSELFACCQEIGEIHVQDLCRPM